MTSTNLSDHIESGNSLRQPLYELGTRLTHKLQGSSLQLHWLTPNKRRLLASNDDGAEGSWLSSQGSRLQQLLGGCAGRLDGDSRGWGFLSGRRSNVEGCLSWWSLYSAGGSSSSFNGSSCHWRERGRDKLMKSRF